MPIVLTVKDLLRNWWVMAVEAEAHAGLPVTAYDVWYEQVGRDRLIEVLSQEHDNEFLPLHNLRDHFIEIVEEIDLAHMLSNDDTVSLMLNNILTRIVTVYPELLKTLDIHKGDNK